MHFSVVALVVDPENSKYLNLESISTSILMLLGTCTLVAPLENRDIATVRKTIITSIDLPNELLCGRISTTRNCAYAPMAGHTEFTPPAKS
jgi:hypothetical protein